MLDHKYLLNAFVIRMNVQSKEDGKLGAILVKLVKRGAAALMMFRRTVVGGELMADAIEDDLRHTARHAVLDPPL